MLGYSELATEGGGRGRREGGGGGGGKGREEKAEVKKEVEEVKRRRRRRRRRKSTNDLSTALSPLSKLISLDTQLAPNLHKDGEVNTDYHDHYVGD